MAKVVVGGQETDLQLPRGTDLVLEFTHRDDAGAVINITGYTFQLDVKPTAKSTSSDFTKSTGSGIAITDAVNGRYDVTIAAADTDRLQVRTTGRRWDCWRTNAGSHRRIAYGKWQLEDEVVDL